MEEIFQLMVDKTKEKGSKHDPKANKEETLVGGGSQNTE